MTASVCRSGDESTWVCHVSPHFRPKWHWQRTKGRCFTTWHVILVVKRSGSHSVFLCTNSSGDVNPLGRGIKINSQRVHLSAVRGGFHRSREHEDTEVLHALFTTRLGEEADSTWTLALRLHRSRSNFGSIRHSLLHFAMALSSSLVALFIALAGVHAVPVQLQGGLNLMRHDEYGPLPSDFASRYLEDHGSSQESWKRNLDQIGGGHLLRSLNDANGYGQDKNRYSRTLDHIGGGHLLRGLNERGLYDFFAKGKRNLDQIGGGNLVRNLDSIGGGNLVRNLDSIGGGNLVRNLDSIGGGNLVRNLDSIGGGNLVRSLSTFGGSLDSIGGGNIVRNLDSIGGGNLVRNLDSIGGGNLVRNLDSIGGGNLVRNLDSIGGGNLVRSLAEDP